jgi:hypothetical protein
MQLYPQDKPMNLTTNILKALALSLIFLLGCVGTASAQVQNNVHTCTVREVLNSGGYSYILCQQGSQEIWLAIMQTQLDIGENISYDDNPPLTNFRVKGLDRTFPQIRFVPGVSRSGERLLETFPSPEATTTEQDAAPYNDQAGVYAGTDDNGALVFTDDPARAPKKSGRKK